MEYATICSIIFLKISEGWFSERGPFSMTGVRWIDLQEFYLGLPRCPTVFKLVLLFKLAIIVKFA